MGTRFIATRESQAQDAYKQMILGATAADIIHTPAVRHPGQLLRQAWSRPVTTWPLTSSHEAGKLKPLDEEAKAWKTVWSAGQGVGEINDLPSAAA
jgi:nitronate monooxygenase